MKISILIPTIRRHDRLLTRLTFTLYGQMTRFKIDGVELIIDDAEKDNVGLKRNRLLEKATGEYLCFFDSDDEPTDHYLPQLMNAVESGKDCASLKGQITFDGENPAIFEHSIKYDKWETVEGEITYLRPPNHLNLICSSIAKQFKFPEINHGEDQDWSMQIKRSGLLKTEYYIPEIIYHYQYITNKK